MSLVSLRSAATLCCLLAATTALAADPVKFSTPPKVTKSGNGATIAFAVSAPTDVEIAILDATNGVVRHLAAGVLGGAKPPPAPLQAGLAQTVAWDGKDDFGRPASGGPFQARVRAGTGMKFGRFIGDDPYNFGALESVAADEAGNIYIAGARGDGNQMAMCLRVFDAEGRYLREMLPFAANLPPGAMKEIGRWDEEAKTWYPRNLRNLNPDFYGQPGGYWGNPALTLVSANSKSGVTLTEGSRIFRLAADGSVPGDTFVQGGLWGKKALPNTGDGPLHLASSPDGRFLYLSGPFSSSTQYGHTADPDFPAGQVYRMEVGKGTMQPFVKLPTIGQRANDGWNSKHIAHPVHYTTPHGPIHGMAVDKDGNVLVADQDGQRIAVFSPDGKELGKIDIPYPEIVAVHPRNGTVYVLTKEIKGYGSFKKTLVKFSGFKDARQEALLDLGTDGARIPQMALAAGEKSTVLWISGVSGGLKPVEDKGATLEPVVNQFKPKPNVPRDWGRLATDYDRDEIYVSNYCVNFWRYNGQTGEGDMLKKNGQPFFGTDLAVGADGLLYVRGGNGFSGPFERYTRDLAPAPFEGGSHVLSPYIYSRMGNGMAERGLGVGLNGKIYLSFMYKWVAYAIGGSGPDGKPLAGKYLKETFPAEKPEVRKNYAPGMDGATIGPIPQMNGGIRVDTKGDIYVGMMYRPKGFPVPKAFEKDQGYRVSVGCVVRFGPEGGTMPGSDGVTQTSSLEGVKQYYPGLAPFSSAAEAFGGNSCCVCRVPRFDIDRYNRLIVPNAMTSSTILYDNAGNTILEFGRYGNFDSQWTAPGESKPRIDTPAIPMAWPTCAGFSEKSVYVLDTYARRVVRADFTYQAEETRAIK